MAQTAGRFLLERLAGWGVKQIHGYPGDGINGINGIIGAFHDVDEPEFVQVRHAELAASAAPAHAKFTDTPLMVGSSFPDAEWPPETGQGRGVQIDIDARFIGTRSPMEHNLVGDAKQTVAALVCRLQRQADRCILTSDSGSATNRWTRHLRLRRGTDAALSDTLASGLPFAGYAELLGPKGVRVDAPDAVAPAWGEAMSADRPLVLEAITDPEVPPLPPHIGFDQAKELSRAILEGDKASPDIVRSAVNGKLAECSNR